MIKNCLNCDKEIKVKPSHYERKKYCSRVCQTNYQKKNPPIFWEKLRKKQRLNCSYCNRDFWRKPSEISKTNFCNLQCKTNYQKSNGHLINQHLRKDVKKICKGCGNTFIIPKNRELTAKYCSKNCLGIANGSRNKVQLKKLIAVICSNCGVAFEKKPSIIRQLNFCSVPCMGNFYSKTQMFAGDKSGTWAGGDISYYGPNWLSQRRKARERDNFQCQDCGITEEQYGSELSVHHIIPFRNYNGDWKSANKLSNLVSLCEYPCHRKRHSKKVDDIV